MFNLLAAIEGIITSVPEAISFWQHLKPLIGDRIEISEEQANHINSLLPAAHAAVGIAHQAIDAIVATHTSAAST